MLEENFSLEDTNWQLITEFLSLKKSLILIGPTVLDGSPVLCILITQGKIKDLEETGMANSVVPKRDAEYGGRYFFRYSSPDKYSLDIYAINNFVG